MVYFMDVAENKRTYLLTLDDKRQHLEKATYLRTHKSSTHDQWPKYSTLLHTNGWCQSHEVGRPLSIVYSLCSTHHHSMGNSEPLPTLGKRMMAEKAACGERTGPLMAEKAAWGERTEFPGEAHFIKGFWEWTEDVLCRCKDDLRARGLYDAVYASLFTYDRNVKVIKAFCESWCPFTNTLLTSTGELSISLWDLHYLSGLSIDGMLYDEVVEGLYTESKSFMLVYI